MDCECTLNDEHDEKQRPVPAKQYKGTGTLMATLYKENGTMWDTYITVMMVLPFNCSRIRLYLLMKGSIQEILVPQCSVRMWAGIPHGHFGHMGTLV